MGHERRASYAVSKESHSHEPLLQIQLKIAVLSGGVTDKLAFGGSYGIMDSQSRTDLCAGLVGAALVETVDRHIHAPHCGLWREGRADSFASCAWGI